MPSAGGDDDPRRCLLGEVSASGEAAHGGNEAFEVGQSLEALARAQPIRIPRVHGVARIEAVEEDHDAKRGEGVHREAHRVDRAEAGVGDEHDERRARSRRRGATVSPSSASGERTPPALSTSSDVRAPGAAESRATRSAIVNGGEAERVGGHRRRHRARHQRCAGHTIVRVSPVAAASTSASVAGRRRVRTTARACGPRRRRRARAALAAVAAATHVLPTSVPVPVTSDDRHRRGRQLAEHVGRARRAARSTCVVGVRGRERDAQPRGARRDGRRPDRGDEQAARRAAPRPHRARAARRRTRPGRSATGGRGAAGRRARAGVRRARRLRPTARPRARRARPRCRRASARW